LSIDDWKDQAEPGYSAAFRNLSALPITEVNIERQATEEKGTGIIGRKSALHIPI
jgi:hypothetical protein